MERKGSFQDKLKKIVIDKLIILVGTGIISFVIGIILVVVFTNYNNAKDNGNLYEETFLRVYDESEDFLRNKELQELCKKVLLFEVDTTGLPYFVYEFNSYSLLNAKVVLSDKERNIAYKSFSDTEWDYYRNSFNKAICANAFHVPMDEIYTSVFYLSGNESNFVLSKPIYEQGRTIGYLNLYIEDGWEECLYDTEYEGVITDDKGRVIYSSRQSFITGINKFENDSISPIITINERRYWKDRRYVQQSNVIIYSLIYYPENNSMFFAAFVVIVLLGFCWFKLADDMTEAMAKSNSSSISKLVSEIQVISKMDSEYRIAMDTEDEFSKVGVQINQMLDSIHDLNHRNTELLRANNVTEIEQLTAQINPHFLYNTLEIIRNLLVFDNKKADSLIIKLTQILRYSINNSRKYVYLEEDMSYIRDYFAIQKARFEENLSYEINIKEECNKCIIPKLLLQPLIENSIKYGFQKKMKIHIWIDGYIEGNMLFLSVKDDGEGMTKEDAKALQKSIYSPISESEHNGLHNIARRLYLLYGTESGLDIYNLETKGLKVIVKINLERG